MRSLKQQLAVLAGALALSVAAHAASAATTVTVKLWDKGADAEMQSGLIYAAPGVDLSKATMGITATPVTVPAGDVTFDVTNTSKDMVHEMLVLYLADPTKPLPYIADDDRVDEENANDKGEVSELDPGKSGSLTLTLDPGKYLLICNVPGHYSGGMWTEIDVK